MNECREQFEDWFADVLGVYMSDGVFDTNQHNDYKNDIVHRAWLKYKAGWKKRGDKE